MKDIRQGEDIKRKNILIPEYLDSDPTEHSYRHPLGVREKIQKNNNAIFQANLKKAFEIIEKNPSRKELSELAASKGAEFISEKLYLIFQSKTSSEDRSANNSIREDSGEQDSIDERKKYIKKDFKEMVEKKLKVLLEKKQ